jgi:cysteinyl-tRNA synthetase
VDPPIPDLTGVDPLALRLALLQHPYRGQAILARGDLETAGQVLRGWREQVSHWALSPSKPMSATYVSDFLGALDDDLDTPSALRSLTGLAGDEEVSDGAKFEAFAYLDRFLGLDLARDVGR